VEPVKRDDDDGGRPKQPPPEVCLTPEVLAAFLDGGLRPDERAHVQAHLVACDDCYALFSESARFLGEAVPVARVDPEAAEAAAVARRGRVASIALPLAVAAMLAIVLVRPSRVVAPTDGPSPPAHSANGPSPTRAESFRPTPEALPSSRASAPRSTAEVPLAGLLTDGADLAVLAGSPWKDDPSGLGFAGGAGRERTLVLLGVHLLDLEVALRAGEVERARDRLLRLRPLAELEGEREAVHDFALLLGGRPTRRLTTDTLRARFEGARHSSGSGPAAERKSWIRFGEWVEAGRLAALSHHSRYFVHPAVRSGLREARSLALPEPTRRPLDAIEGLLKPHPVSETEWRRLERTFGQVLLLL